jgi:hypothetical protein
MVHHYIVRGLDYIMDAILIDVVVLAQKKWAICR